MKRFAAITPTRGLGDARTVKLQRVLVLRYMYRPNIDMIATYPPQMSMLKLPHTLGEVGQCLGIEQLFILPRELRLRTQVDDELRVRRHVLFAARRLRR